MGRLWQRFIAPLRTFLHRGQHGWAPSDTWNTDMYLAKVIAEMLHYLADTDRWYPPPFESHVDWTCYLHQLATRFEDYQTLEVGTEHYAHIVQDLYALFDHFGDLWS